MSGPPFDYLLFGLRVRSELELPELLAVTGTGDPDVQIRLGRIASVPGGAGLRLVEDGLLFVAPDAARYKVVNGGEIIVAPNAGAPERNVRLYLLGSAFGALLHQRGLLPLHANAVEIEGKAVAFMGESGAGKSTLAAWFHDQGYKVLADDVCVVKCDFATPPRAMPGVPRLRLWKEALEASGRDPAIYERSWVGTDGWDKFDVPLGEHSIVDAERELAATYVLQRGEELAIERVEGAPAAQALIENTYRGRHVLVGGDPRLHWEACVRLASYSPIFRLTRPWSLPDFDEVMSRVLPHILSTLAESQPVGST